MPDNLFERVIAELRPQLHRYCARMTGSVIDGDDVVQEAALNAFAAAEKPQTRVQIEAWLFRIAHNAAVDLLRRRNRLDALHSDEELDMIPDPAPVAEQREIASASLHTFMRLPPVQRSAVVMKDVLGYSLQEVGNMTGSNLAAVKAALHRGRARLRELAHEMVNETQTRPAAILSEPDRTRLTQYVERFNARDFDAVRAMLAEDVKLDLVAHHGARGRELTSNYFGNYAALQNWRLSAGLVDGRPAVIVRDREDPDGRPRYFILLEWVDGKLAGIRDYVFARYVMDGAEISVLE